MRGTVAGVAVLVLLCVSFAPAAQARTRCAYAGPPANVMTVTVSGSLADGIIERRGLEISASEFLEQPRPCTGGTPTVLNTDTIRVVLSGAALGADVRLGRGPFAPGATPEAEEASEIEIRVSGSDALANVVATPAGDELHWGPGGVHPGLNLNPRAAADTDVDVTISGPDAFLVAQGAGGSDRITGGPGTPGGDGVFSQGGSGSDVLEVPEREGGILDGESGNDRITGGRLDDQLDGGRGNDRVNGGSGPDHITGGPGRDRLVGGAGRDLIVSRDSRRDLVRCGPGRDRVTADRRDRVSGCERVNRR